MRFRFQRWVVLGIMVAVLGGVHLNRMPPDRLQVDFLDVGQGDAILLSLPTGERILVDGGPEQTVLQELGEVLPFLERRLDLIVLTHPHADHLMGLVQVLKRYEVKEVLFTGVNYPSPIYDEFLREIREQGIPLKVARADEDFHFGAVRFDVIFPLTSLMGSTLSNINNGSIVIKVTTDTSSLLLTGDAELEVEEILVQAHDRGDIDLHAGILKAGHHGSRTSSSPAFIERVRPRMAVIQCGIDNTFGHPRPETLSTFKEMGVEVRRNDLEGRIRIQLE